jgi:hypothetical protein
MQLVLKVFDVRAQLILNDQVFILSPDPRSHFLQNRRNTPQVPSHPCLNGINSGLLGMLLHN